MTYKVYVEDTAHIICCPSSVDGKKVGALDSEMKTWLLSTAEVHVLDFKDVTTLDPSAFRPFVAFKQALRANGKSLFVVHMRAPIQALVKQHGLDSVFTLVASVDEARRKASTRKPVADAKLLNIFVQATQQVLETQAQMNVASGKPYLKKPTDVLEMDIAGLLSMNCSDFHGTISLCFPAAVFLKIYEKMVGEKLETITPESEDAAGEIVNIIFGQAKTVLNDQNGYNLGKALPTVLAGTRLKIHHQGSQPSIILPFSSSLGNFHMEIMIDKG